VKSDGTLWEWGRPRFVSNNVGEDVLIPKPTQVGMDHDWTEVWTSPFVNVAMKQDGSVWRWHFVRSTNNIANTVDHPERWLNMPHSDPISVSVADEAIAAVFSDGSLWIGGGLARAAGRDSREMNRWGQDTDWQQVLVTPFAFAGLRQNGSLWRWNGLSGLNPTSSPFFTPSRYSD